VAARQILEALGGGARPHGGNVKVLDFGHAAVVQDLAVSDVDVTQCPTLTMAATRAGSF